MDFSFLNTLPNANDVPDNHPNLPYPMFEIITGKNGSGKTHLAFSQVLKPGFIDYQQFYLVSPELSKKTFFSRWDSRISSPKFDIAQF